MKLAQLGCSLVVGTLILLGVTAMTLNLVLIVLGFATGQIINPSYGILLLLCLSVWISAFGAAVILRIAQNRFSSKRIEGRCRACGYDLTFIRSDNCPECGLNKFGED